MDRRRGHFYWFYKYIYEKQARNGFSWGKTLGPSSTIGDFTIPVLPKKRHARYVHRFWSATAIRPWKVLKTLQGLIISGLTHLQIYDGDFGDLLLAVIIAIRFPRLTVVFNFHWPLELLAMFERKNLLSHWIRDTALRLIRARPTNLVLCAETQKLADKIQSMSGLAVGVYPIFSSVEILENRNWADREIDLLIAPQRQNEMDFSCELATLGVQGGLKVSVLVRGDVLERQRRIDAKWQHPGFDVLATPIKEDEYRELLLSSKTVCLPYGKEYFKWGSSGKFNEAIDAGAFPFAPRGSAIVTQSSLPEDFHEIQSDPFQALHSVLNRLKAGMPANLHPVSFESFLEWLSSISSPRSLPVRPSIWRDLFLAHVAFSLYRPPQSLRLTNVQQTIARKYQSFRTWTIRKWVR